MNQIEQLLGEVNRLYEEDLAYKPAGADDYTPVRGTREVIDTAEYISDGAPQSWRLAAFSFARAELLDGEGNRITPRRGDMLRAADGTYRLIEYGGLAWTPRFDAGFSERILIYFERERDGNQN